MGFNKSEEKCNGRKICMGKILPFFHLLFFRESLRFKEDF